MFLEKRRFNHAKNLLWQITLLFIKFIHLFLKLLCSFSISPCRFPSNINALEWMMFSEGIKPAMIYGKILIIGSINMVPLDAMEEAPKGTYVWFWSPMHTISNFSISSIGTLLFASMTTLLMEAVDFTTSVVRFLSFKIVKIVQVDKSF